MTGRGRCADAGGEAAAAAAAAASKANAIGAFMSDSFPFPAEAERPPYSSTMVM
jgi:hypothetical protein